jgi:UPF0755 protein
MKKNQLNLSSKKTFFILIIVFLVCILLVFAIGLNLIHTENTRLIGLPLNELSYSQELIYDSIFFVRQNDLQKKKADLQNTTIRIETDKPLDKMLIDLEYSGVVDDSSLLRKVLIYTGADRKILPGKYSIPAGSSILEIASILQDPNASLVDFAVLPGWRKEEIAAVLPASGLSITPQDFLSIVNQPVKDKGLLSQGFTTYEGTFYPGSYSFQRDISSNDFIKALTDRFQSELSEEVIAGFTKQGLSVSQAGILASIIQREAILDEEKPIIASVFINRLKNGMPLQSDPTVQYALGFRPDSGWWKSPLSLDDLQIDSPYNTYIIAGLPPSPISNPDADSLQAVAFPAETNYLYFRALCDGSKSHVFSETLEEHINNACPEAGS